MCSHGPRNLRAEAYEQPRRRAIKPAKGWPKGRLPEPRPYRGSPPRNGAGNEARDERRRRPGERPPFEAVGRNMGGPRAMR